MKKSDIKKISKLLNEISGGVTPAEPMGNDKTLMPTTQKELRIIHPQNGKIYGAQVTSRPKF